MSSVKSPVKSPVTRFRKFWKSELWSSSRENARAAVWRVRTVPGWALSLPSSVTTVKSELCTTCWFPHISSPWHRVRPRQAVLPSRLRPVWTEDLRRSIMALLTTLSRSPPHSRVTLTNLLTYKADYCRYSPQSQLSPSPPPPPPSDQQSACLALVVASQCSVGWRYFGSCWGYCSKQGNIYFELFPCENLPAGEHNSNCCHSGCCCCCSGCWRCWPPRRRWRPSWRGRPSVRARLLPSLPGRDRSPLHCRHPERRTSLPSFPPAHSFPPSLCLSEQWSRTRH